MAMADDKTDFFTPAAGKSCGSCNMCCKVLQIDDLAKPAGAWCKNAKPGIGCTIYETRPGSCQAFFCEWILNKDMGPEWKPDAAKFVVNPLTSDANLLIGVDPNFANAWRREPYHTQIRQWVKSFEAIGRFVLVRIGSRCIALLPDKDVDLGIVNANDDVFISREMGPAGLVYSAEVRRKSA
jgi:hypothetical protein